MEKEIEDSLKVFLSNLIIEKCNDYALDYQIVAAIILQESRLASRTLYDSIYAVRYEPGFYRRYILGKKLTGYTPKRGIPTRATERKQRAMSYGLMQVMGATARENGLKTQYITALCDPERNIEIGCRYLKRLLIQESLDYREALRRYNGLPRGNFTYADKVLGLVQSGEYREVCSGKTQEAPLRKI